MGMTTLPSEPKERIEVKEQHSGSVLVSRVRGWKTYTITIKAHEWRDFVAAVNDINNGRKAHEADLKSLAAWDNMT